MLQLVRETHWSSETSRNTRKWVLLSCSIHAGKNCPRLMCTTVMCSFSESVHRVPARWNCSALWSSQECACIQVFSSMQLWLRQERSYSRSMQLNVTFTVRNLLTLKLIDCSSLQFDSELVMDCVVTDLKDAVFDWAPWSISKVKPNTEVGTVSYPTLLIHESPCLGPER